MMHHWPQDILQHICLYLANDEQTVLSMTCVCQHFAQCLHLHHHNGFWNQMRMYRDYAFTIQYYGNCEDYIKYREHIIPLLNKNIESKQYFEQAMDNNMEQCRSTVANIMDLQELIAENVICLCWDTASKSREAEFICMSPMLPSDCIIYVSAVMYYMYEMGWASYRDNIKIRLRSGVTINYDSYELEFEEEEPILFTDIGKYYSRDDKGVNDMNEILLCLLMFTDCGYDEELYVRASLNM
jgi:hypothetical protein